MENLRISVPKDFEEVPVFLGQVYKAWLIDLSHQPTISLRWSSGGDLFRGRYEPPSNKIYCVVSRVCRLPTDISLPVEFEPTKEGFGFKRYTTQVSDYVEPAMFIIGSQIWEWLVWSRQVLTSNTHKTVLHRAGFGLLSTFRLWRELRLDRFPELLELIDQIY